MMRRLSLVCASALALMAFGCGDTSHTDPLADGGDDTNNTGCPGEGASVLLGSCVATTWSCMEYSALPSDPNVQLVVSGLQSGCGQGGGTWSTEPCSRSGVACGCAATGGSTKVVLYTYNADLCGDPCTGYCSTPVQ